MSTYETRGCHHDVSGQSQTAALALVLVFLVVVVLLLGNDAVVAATPLAVVLKIGTRVTSK